MVNDINLVSNKDESTLKQKKQLRFVRITAVVSLAIVFLFSVLIFVISSMIGLSSIKNSENSALNSISFLHKKEAELAIVNNRLQDITTILQNRKNYTSEINSLLQIIPSGAYVNSIEINKDSLTLVIVSNSLLPINSFLNSLTGFAQKNQLVKDVIIENLSINGKTGLYSLSIQATIL